MNLSEAFKQLDCLNEDVFEVSDKGIEELKDFRDSDDSDNTIEVIDPEAENKEEIKDSYVGKIICRCNVCKSLVYFDKDNIQIDEENSTVSADEECPFCFTNSGYSIVGEVAPYSDYQVEATDEDGNKVDVEVTVDGRDIPQGEETPNAEDDNDLEAIEVEENDDDSETEKSVEKDEKLSLSKRKNESVRGNRMRKDCSESLDSIKLDDGNQEIEIKTKEKEDLSKDSMMVPPSDDTLEDILSDEESEIEEPDEESEVKNPVEDEEIDEEPMPEDGDIVDVDVDEVEDESFNRLGESFLKKVYENVKSFRTTSAATNGNTLVLEGLITFKSGKSKSTTFKFEANKINSKGKIRFLGENKDISSGRKSFALNCKVSKKAIIPESMTYNYVARGLNESQRVTGTVRLNESTRIRRR